MRSEALDRLCAFWLDILADGSIEPAGYEPMPNELISYHAAWQLVSSPASRRHREDYGFTVGFELAIRLVSALLEDPFGDPTSAIGEAIGRAKVELEKFELDREGDEARTLTDLARSFKRPARSGDQADE